MTDFHPDLAGTEVVERQQTRQARLEALYEQDGRHDPQHPRHGLYTGLEAAARLARWREGCLATPLPIKNGTGVASDCNDFLPN